MFGYLNLNDPTKIGETEAQEAKNLRLDRGFIEFQEYEIDETINRKATDINNLEIFLDTSNVPSGSVVAPLTEQGFIKRRISDTRVDIIGLSGPAGLADYSVGTVPKLTAVAHGSQVYPPGEIEYAITIYNPETNTESDSANFTRTVGVNETVQFEDFPSVSNGSSSTPDLFNEKTEAEFRIYRRPIGGSEFLRILSDTTIPAYTGATGPYLDTTADEDLGEPCRTVYPTVFAPYVYPEGNNTSIIEVHNNRLWFKQNEKRDGSFGLDSAGSVLWFSRPYVYGEVPVDNYFVFNSPIVGLHSLNEALVVICQKDIFIIYGDNEKDFVVKQATSSKIGGAGGFASASIGNMLCFLASDKTDRAKGNGIFTVMGNNIARASFQIDPIFPISKYATGEPLPVFGAGSVEDRFFVVRYENGQKLVYDVLAQGFLQASTDDTFSYRSKEFGRPGIWDDTRRAFVRGLGDFKVELYYDGIKEDEIEFSIPGSVPQTEDFTVPGLRNNYFSFRFVGQQNAKIYEFGRLE
jgi:hypothetical protein